LYIRVNDFRELSVANLSIKLSLTCGASPPTIKDMPFLADRNLKTDGNGIVKTRFNAPIFAFKIDAWYYLNVEAELRDGKKVFTEHRFQVTEKKYDTKFTEQPPVAAPGTWYKIIVYDFDFKPITVSLTQNGFTKVKTYENDDWQTLESMGTYDENTGKGKTNYKISGQGDEYSTIRRCDGENSYLLHFVGYPDNSVIYDFLVTEVLGNDILISFEGISNGLPVKQTYEIPSKQPQNPVIGVTDRLGYWFFECQCGWEGLTYKDNDIIGTCQGGNVRIYGIGFKDTAELKIFNGTNMVVNETLASDNYESYYEWNVPKNIDTGNYTMKIEGIDFNNEYYSFSLEFYVGIELKDTGLYMTVISRTLFYFILIFIIIISVLFGYTRLKKRKLLHNLIRKRIYRRIESEPGIHFRGLLNELKLNLGTLSYHINVLEDRELIISRQDGQYRRFYLIDDVKSKNKYFLPRIQEKLLNIVTENPGISQSDMSKHLGKSRVLINYHIKLMNKSGLIFLEKKGRVCKCYPVS